MNSTTDGERGPSGGPGPSEGSPVGLSTGDVVTTEPIKILLVDDLASNLTALEAMLATTGCFLVRAQSADEALLALLDGDFAAVVLDIKMPGISGLELAKLIKSRKRTRQVPILLVTAYMLDEADMLKGYEAGAVSYLTKPINPIVLQSKIAVFADLYRNRRALALSNESLQREVTERHKAEEALRIANHELEARVLERTEALQDSARRKDEFLATLAHELRNPLAPISYALQIFSSKCPPTPELIWARDVIDRQLRQMTRLVDDLLDVSRISHGKLELRIERAPLDVVVSDALETCRPLIDGAGLRLEVDLPSEPVSVDADRLRLAQCFVNLLNNSVKHTPPGGTISLRATRQGSAVEISVKDTGAGIPPEMLGEVFEMFTQVDRGLERSQGGLGVGLAIVRKIVTMHGGTIEARSEGLGTGSEFTIRLGVIQDLDSVPRASTPTGLREFNRHRILIAEDSRDAADSFGMLLSIMGHEVRVTYDGQEAVAAADVFRPDVIIMDVGMPRLNGYDAARHIRAQPWGKDMFLIALTGWGQSDDRDQSQQAGFDRHFTKPVDPSVLETLLSSLPNDGRP